MLIWGETATPTSESNRDLRHDGFDLPYVFLVSNLFDPVEKASSVMAASVGSTTPAIRAYHSSNAETQLKPVALFNMLHLSGWKHRLKWNLRIGRSWRWLQLRAKQQTRYLFFAKFYLFLKSEIIEWLNFFDLIVDCDNIIKAMFFVCLTM